MYSKSWPDATNTDSADTWRIAPLERVRGHREPSVIEGFIKRFDMPEDEAEALFEDTAAWLWLCATFMSERGQPDFHGPDELLIDRPLIAIDEMWHVFILYTREYEAFCRDYFGRFIHHIPTTRTAHQSRLEQRRTQSERFLEARRDRARRQYLYIHDKLGEARLLRWYSEFPDRYTAETMNRMHKGVRDIPPW